MAKNLWDLYSKIMPPPEAGPYGVPGPGGVMPGAGMGIPMLPPAAFGAMPPSLGAVDPSYYSGGGFRGDKLLDRAPLKAPFAADQGAPPAGPSPAIQWAVEAIRNGADPKAVRAQLNRFAQDSSVPAPSDPLSDSTSNDFQRDSKDYVPDQFGLGRPQFDTALAHSHESSLDPDGQGSNDEMPSPEDGLGKPGVAGQSMPVAAAFQPDDRPENPLTHMMATDERVLQPRQAPPPPRRFDPYSEANLSLGPNEQYRADILAAARSNHLTPQGLAATIGTEMLPGRWNPNAVNGQTGATGLSQFTSTTWTGEANRRGSFLNNVARSLGYLDDHGHLRSANARQFLALRNNPRLSIWAAADYAAHNLGILQSQGYIRNQSPAALARYAYLAHHEGLGGARSFLRGAMHINEATFLNNITRPADRARYLAAAGNDRNRAYRDYHSDLIDRSVDVTRYMINRDGVELPPTRSLYR